MIQQPCVAVRRYGDILAAWAKYRSAIGAGLEKRPGCLLVGAEHSASRGVADRIIRPGVVVRRIKQVVSAAVFPKCWRLDQVALPGLVLFDQLGRLAFK